MIEWRRRRFAHGLVLLAASIALALAFASRADACTCMWGGPFLTVAPKVEIVVHVRIRGYHGHGRGPSPLAMDADVIEQLKGPAVPRDIRIWGDNGALCRPYVSGFPLGTEWIVAIYPQRREMPGAEGYVIPGCGAYWLRVLGNRVQGQIRAAAPGAREQEESLDAVRNALISR